MIGTWSGSSQLHLKYILDPVHKLQANIPLSGVYLFVLILALCHLRTGFRQHKQTAMCYPSDNLSARQT